MYEKKLPSFGRKVEEANERMAGWLRICMKIYLIKFCSLFKRLSIIKLHIKNVLMSSSFSYTIYSTNFLVRKRSICNFYPICSIASQGKRIIKLHLNFSHCLSTFMKTLSISSTYSNNLFTIYNKLISTNVLELFHHLHLKKLSEFFSLFRSDFKLRYFHR